MEIYQNYFGCAGNTRCFSWGGPSSVIPGFFFFFFFYLFIFFFLGGGGVGGGGGGREALGSHQCICKS